jgi:hypothetical protein
MSYGQDSPTAETWLQHSAVREADQVNNSNETWEMPMHLRAIRSAIPSTSPSPLRPAYNLFRCKHHLDLFCAVPEDYPVPAFVDGHGWAFAGKVDEPSGAPLGFKLETVRAILPLTGFYLFRASCSDRERTRVQPMKRAA